MNTLEPLLRTLADGRFHSGEQLAEDLHCTRSAIWKRMQRLHELTGLEIDSVTGRGYRLRRPLQLLDKDRLIGALQGHQLLEECHVLGSVGSTNALAKLAKPSPGRGIAWFAEHQSDGRGRRGRSWVSPYGRNIYFSLAWRFDVSLVQLSGLSIACGAVLAGLLSSYGLQGHGLKWPNDLLWGGRKLAGILVELSGESDGPAFATIGIGINLDLGTEWQQHIDQPYASLRDAGLQVDRTAFAAELLDTVVQMCVQFNDTGLGGFLSAWRDYDVFSGRPVRLIGPASEQHGQCLGLGDDGSLRLRVGDRVTSHYSGELSLRPGDEP